MNWSNITLSTFQRIDLIHQASYSDVDKLLFTTCAIYNLTEYQLDNTPVNKATRLINSVRKVFESPFTPKPSSKIGVYKIDYDISNMRFAQYTELCFFLNNTVQNAHKILASVSRKPFRKNSAATHEKRAGYFLNRPFAEVIGCVNEVKKAFQSFNKEYEWLFGVPKAEQEVQADPFSKKYGWFYAAEQVAAYERVSMDAVFNLPVRQVLGDIAYLKARSKFEEELRKKK